MMAEAGQEPRPNDRRKEGHLMINPMNTKQIVDLHTQDLERLVEPRRWQAARRQATASLRRWRLERESRPR